MFLGRLRIRGKLTLLVTIPLLAMIGLIFPVVRESIRNVNAATDTNTVATVAGRIGTLLQDLQRERLLSVGYLLGVVDQDDLVLQVSAVTDRVVDLREDLGDDLTPEVRAAIDRVQQLSAQRQRVLSKTISPEEALDGFIETLDGMIDALHLVEHADATTAAGRQLVALDALLRMDESNTESTAMLAIMSVGDVQKLSIRYHEERTEYDTYLERFTLLATEHQNELYALVAKAFQDRVGANFDDEFDNDPVKTMQALPIGTLFPALQSFSVVGTFVEKRLVDDVTSLVDQQKRQELTVAYGVGAVALVVLLGVLILVAAVARAVARPLRRLTRSAELVADAGEQELRRVADDDAETVEPVRLDVLEVNANDEIGELARAFERVQSTATQLVERQVMSRRNVAEMFGHIGRRTQNLVGRQVDLIDRLETQETDPDRLEQLYHLDHISNRLRRSADSLVVISGTGRDAGHTAPVRLIDVARLALAEIEEYTRVDVDIPLDLAVAPAVVSDLVLMCAELLENATNYSPPHTRVSVTAQTGPDGARLVIADRGIGMADERLTEENARIARRERLDLVPTQVLGLFVVGRLARRHGFGVALAHTTGGGVTATVSIGHEQLSGGRIEVPGMAELEALTAVERVSDRVTDRATDGATHRVADRVTDRVTDLEARPITGETLPVLWGVDAPTEPRPMVYRSASHAEASADDLWAWRPWNAFEIKPRPAPPQEEPPPSAPPVVVPTSTSGLRRRVPTARVPHPPAPPVADRAPDAADALAALELVEALESGVRRAEDVAAVSAAENRPLSRRVPGATLPVDAYQERASVARTAVVLDPEAARSLVEQFELGVSRALHDAANGTESEEGTSR